MPGFIQRSATLRTSTCTLTIFRWDDLCFRDAYQIVIHVHVLELKGNLRIFCLMCMVSD